MPGWALRLSALVATLLVFVGSFDYVAAHVKNTAAPLHPPVDGLAAEVTAPPSSPVPGQTAPTALPQLVPNRGKPRPTSSPGPIISLQPGVRATALPSIAITHVS
jgi:hypothetical protein